MLATKTTKDTSFTCFYPLKKYAVGLSLKSQLSKAEQITETYHVSYKQKHI